MLYIYRCVYIFIYVYTEFLRAPAFSKSLTWTAAAFRGASQKFVPYPPTPKLRWNPQKAVQGLGVQSLGSRGGGLGFRPQTLKPKS